LDEKSLRVPFFMPLLIGPPATLLGGTLGFPWLGGIVALGGTFVVVQDALKMQPASRWLTCKACLLSLVFCLFWLAVAAGLVAGLDALFEEESPFEIG
jgi:hypothetical protein